MFQFLIQIIEIIFLRMLAISPNHTLIQQRPRMIITDSDSLSDFCYSERSCWFLIAMNTTTNQSINPNLADAVLSLAGRQEVSAR
jgi:hypothetical protein